MKRLLLVALLVVGCKCPDPPPEYIALNRQLRSDLVEAVKRHPGDYDPPEAQRIQDAMDSAESWENVTPPQDQ